MRRRHFLNTVVTAGAASALATRHGPAADDDPSSIRPITDSNVSLFHWPGRRLPLDDTDALLEKMRSLGIARAWAGSFEGLLHRDLAAVNRRLADACAPHPELVPIGSVNPGLPGWEDDLKRCDGEHGMPGIRLHPNYHGYSLDDPRFDRLLELAAEAGLLVQLAALLEDPRTQSTLLQVPDVDLAPLPATLTRLPGARVQLLNWRPRGDLLEKLAEIPGLTFDIARVEATDGVAALLKAVPRDRVLFGTHAPFLIPEASLIRVHESALDGETLTAVLGENAARILEGRKP